MNKYLKPEVASFEYDFENDIFYIHPVKREYVSSHQMGEFVFDLDKAGKVNGIEIMNASNVFNVEKIYLKDHHKGEVEISVNEDIVKFKISITTKVRNGLKTGSLNVERVRPEFFEPMHLNMAQI